MRPRWRQDGPKMATRRPKMAPRRPKTAPRRPKTAQDGPRGLRDGAKTAQDGPKMARRRPKTAPRRPKTGQDGPRRPQDGTKTAQDGPKMAPRWPQDGPRWRQDGPRWHKMAPRWPKMRRCIWLPLGSLQVHSGFLLVSIWLPFCEFLKAFWHIFLQNENTIPTTFQRWTGIQFGRAGVSRSARPPCSRSAGSIRRASLLAQAVLILLASFKRGSAHSAGPSQVASKFPPSCLQDASKLPTFRHANFAGHSACLFAAILAHLGSLLAP